MMQKSSTVMAVVSGRKISSVALVGSVVLLIVVIFTLKNRHYYLEPWRSHTSDHYYYFQDGPKAVEVHKPIRSNDALTSALKTLFALVTPSLRQATYIDPDGDVWRYPNNTGWKPIWSRPLGKQVCIFDMDDRPLKEFGESFTRDPFNWDNVDQLPSGVLDHYLFSLIHGYKYYYVRVPPYMHRSVYWSKIPVISDLLLSSCRIVLSIDHDAIFRNLALPIEWMLNHWNFTQQTSFLMGLDPNDAQNRDARGRLMINAGMIVAQNLPRTHEILRAWDSCPSNGSFFPGCRQYINTWPAEQGAWSTFIRETFNRSGDYIEVPCTEVNGFPGMGTECWGSLIRHYTTGKDRVHDGVSSSVMHAVMGMTRRHLLWHEEEVTVRRGSNAFERSWSYEGGGAKGDIE